MRIAICEDQYSDSAGLSAMLADYVRAKGLMAETDVFQSGEDLLRAFHPGKYQILFQDVYLSLHGANGMEVAEKIRETDNEMAIVFVTINEGLGSAAYDVDAAYYIVKPLDKDKLDRAMQKCQSKLERYAKTVTFMENRQMATIRLQDICYVEVILHNVILHTTKGPRKTSATFGELVKKLGGLPFVVCHRSYAVNLLHVTGMESKDFVMKDKARVPISKSFFADADKAFREYFWW